MIGIKYNGRFLNLAPDATIRFSLFSPMFSNDQGGYSFPFNLSIEDNSSVLGMIDQLNYYGSVTSGYNVQVYFNGLFWKTGILKIQHITNGQYVVNINVDVAVLANIVGSTKLAEVDLGGDRQILSSNFQKITYTFSGSGTTGTMTLAVASSKEALPFYTTVNFDTSIANTLNLLASTFNASWPARGSLGMGNAVASGNTISVSSIDESVMIMNYNNAGIMTDAGTGRTFTIADDLYGVQDMLNHMAAVVASPSDYDYAFFPVYNPFFYSDNTTYCGYMNYYTGGQFAYNGIAAFNGYSYNICPFPYFEYVLKQCLAQFGFSTSGTFLDDAEIKDLVIYNNYALDRYYWTGDGITGRGVTGAINLKNHVPDMTVADFIKAVQNNFFLCFFNDYERKKVVVKTKNEILLNPDYEDWTALADPYTDEDLTAISTGFILSPIIEDDGAKDKTANGVPTNSKGTVATYSALPSTPIVLDIYFITSLNKYYQWDGLAWQEWYENIDSYKVGDGATTVELQACATATQKFTAVSGADKKWIVPDIKQEGSNGEDEGINPAELRFLFYRGLQADGDSNNYPLGTPYHYNYNEASVGSYSLDATSIYSQWGKKWTDFLTNTRVVKMYIRMDVNAILNIDFSKKKRIKEVTYLLASLDFNVSQTGKIEAYGMFYKVG